MKYRFIRKAWVWGLLLTLNMASWAWAEEARVYYTNGQSVNLTTIKERFVPVDMTVQKFLDTFWPPLPTLDANTKWTLVGKNGISVRPWDLVADPNNPAGKSPNNPWIITKAAVGL